MTRIICLVVLLFVGCAGKREVLPDPSIDPPEPPPPPVITEKMTPIEKLWAKCAACHKQFDDRHNATEWYASR